MHNWNNEVHKTFPCWTVCAAAEAAVLWDLEAAYKRAAAASDSQGFSSYQTQKRRHDNYLFVTRLSPFTNWSTFSSEGLWARPILMAVAQKPLCSSASLKSVNEPKTRPVCVWRAGKMAVLYVP